MKCGRFRLSFSFGFGFRWKTAGKLLKFQLRVDRLIGVQNTKRCATINPKSGGSICVLGSLTLHVISYFHSRCLRLCAFLRRLYLHVCQTFAMCALPSSSLPLLVACGLRSEAPLQVHKKWQAASDSVRGVWVILKLNVCTRACVCESKCRGKYKCVRVCECCGECVPRCCTWAYKEDAKASILTCAKWWSRE